MALPPLAQVAESVDASDLKSAVHYGRASSSLALGIGIFIPQTHKRYMAKPEYGTVKWYAEMFSDIISDVGCHDTIPENIEEGRKILAGFEQAMDSWIKYHSNATISFQSIKDEFLVTHRFDYQAALDNEELSLPDIPSFPTLGS